MARCGYVPAISIYGNLGTGTILTIQEKVDKVIATIEEMGYDDVTLRRILDRIAIRFSVTGEARKALKFNEKVNFSR